MKKRILSLLLAVSIACSMLVVPANAAASNAAVQTAVTLGGLTSEQASALSTALTRGQLAAETNMPPISALPSSRDGSAAIPMALSGPITA